EPSVEDPGVDWFDLSLGVMIDGERVDLLPTFTQLLSRLPAGRELDALAELVKNADGTQGRLLAALPGGRILPISLDKVAPILTVLLSVWGSAELAAGPKLHPAQARDLADLEASLAGHVELVGGTRLKALAEELAAFRDRPPVELPAWFGGSLRPYQQAGVDWLQMLARTGFGGVLADDMGLGKTVQLLAHLSIEKEAGRLEAPALVVAPTSVLGNWHAEARRFAPALAVLVHQGLGRAKEHFDTAGIDVVVTSYPLLARDRRFLVDRRWSIAALDEAQTIRNPLAATSLAAFALDAGQRIALSGTPVENHLGDVWSLMRFLNPGLLGDAKSFRTLYRTPIEKGSDAGARTRLSRRLKPFMLRRTKAEVAADLPEKTEIRENVTLTPAQHQLYEATRLVMQRKVREALDRRGLAKSAIVVLDALLKLRQACCDPRLVKSAAGTAKAGDSAKLARLVELLVELKAEGRSALIFSQFTSMLDLIRAELDARGWHYAWLTGDTIDRATPVARFQAGEVDLFLISLKAGGVGLNLTRADTVILYDPWWNPAVEAQAIDRAHRIGQTRKVFIHRLIAEGTIEEKMIELQARKQGLAEALWEGGAGGFAGLTDADVRDLFE
ncbi:MAG TPA: DEAD/DEAH box helicase, partial [Reyranella sp.]|nr:DEAD/DEAH box helicase [Reyranella sp.]